MTAPRKDFPEVAEYSGIAAAALAAPVDNLAQSAALALDLLERIRVLGVFDLMLDWPIDLDDRVQGLAHYVRNATAEAEEHAAHADKRAEFVERLRAAAAPVLEDPNHPDDLMHAVALLLDRTGGYIKNGGKITGMLPRRFTVLADKLTAEREAVALMLDRTTQYTDELGAKS